MKQSYVCENCKKNCNQLELDKERKKWVCHKCEDVFLKEKKYDTKPR